MPPEVAISLALKLIQAAYNAYQHRQDQISEENLDEIQAIMRAHVSRWDELLKD